MTNLKTPSRATLAEIPATWTAVVREIVDRERAEGRAVRAGAGNTLEVKSLTTNEWIVLQLPSGARAFASMEDRDAVLAQINGERS